MANLNLRQETTGTTFGGDERGVGGNNECPEIFSRKDKLFDNLIEVNTPAIEPTPGEVPQGGRNLFSFGEFRK